MQYLTQEISILLEPKLNLKGEITVLLEINSSIDKVYTNSELSKELKKLKQSQVSAMLAKNSLEDRSTIYKRCVKLLNKDIVLNSILLTLPSIRFDIIFT